MHTGNAPVWIWSPLPGQPRWSSVITGIAVFLVVLRRTWRPLNAAAATMAWLCGYEILYEATGTLLHGWSLGTLALTTVGTGGWLILAYVLGIRPDRRVFAGFVVLWAVWIIAGYESNMPDRIIPGAAATWSWRDELLNVGTKVLLAVAVAMAERDAC
jgi:hypothetical protein